MSDLLKKNIVGFPMRWLNFVSLLPKECAPRTGNLPLESLPRNNVARITDHPNITIAID